MKRFLAIFLSLVVFVLAFSGCNNDLTETEVTEAQKVTEKRPEPVAQISPEEIDPGRQKKSANPSDLWYPDKKDGSYFYLQKANGYLITFVNGDKKDTYVCSVTDDNRLVSDKKGFCDIVFYDAFNCYDYVKKEWYTRGDVEKIESAFSGKTLVSTKDQENLYIFGNDKTITEKYKGFEYTGTWTLIAETVMRITFGKNDYYYTFDIDVDSDGNVIGISQHGGRTFRFER